MERQLPTGYPAQERANILVGSTTSLPFAPCLPSREIRGIAGDPTRWRERHNRRAWPSKKFDNLLDDLKNH